ncbi:MAG: response regulator [Chloroflexi bacterium]|nr:MAG: response regulator [Chloroflexota bacterium]
MAAKILVIEDDALVRFFISEVLGRAGYEVTALPDAEGGLTHVEQELPDLLVVDLQLEGMDGMAFLGALRSAKKVLPALVITAQGAPERARQALDLGAVDFVPKPCTAQELREAVAFALDSTARENRRQALVRCLIQEPGLPIEMVRQRAFDNLTY